MRSKWMAVMTVAVILTGCGMRPQAPRRGAMMPGVIRTFAIGPLTATEEAVPSLVYRDPGHWTILGGVLYSIGAVAPYELTERPLGKGQTVVLKGPWCPVRPSFATRIVDPIEVDAICFKSPVPMLNIFSYPGSGGMALPAPPKGESSYSLTGSVVQGPQLFWTAQDLQSGEAISSGILFLPTGQMSPMPPIASRDKLLVSPDLEAYWVSGNSVVQGGATGHLVQLGSVPYAPQSVIGDGGIVWDLLQLPGKNTEFIREVPGQTAVERWSIHGEVIGTGPGYVAYIPDGPTKGQFDVMFPLEGRTLRFSGLLGPPYATPFHPGYYVWPTSGGSKALEIQQVHF